MKLRITNITRHADAYFITPRQGGSNADDASDYIEAHAGDVLVAFMHNPFGFGPSWVPVWSGAGTGEASSGKSIGPFLSMSPSRLASTERQQQGG